jgi:hypothetical protein
VYFLVLSPYSFVSQFAFFATLFADLFAVFLALSIAVFYAINESIPFRG